jgi:predicted RNA binding protein YcfA (HicA-like mRNA interferase family)
MARMREIVKLITHDGWQLIALRGPHWQFVHPTKPGRVTISGHLEHEVGRGTLRSLTRQAQVSLKERKQHGPVLSRR